MLKPAIRTFESIQLGESVEFEVEITAELVDAFAQLTGDTNPLHMDDVYARSTPYGARIAHGMLVASFLSRLVGMHLPGLHSVYLSQSLFFRKPVTIGTRIIIKGTVTQRIDAAQCIKLEMKVLDQTRSTTFIDGEALVKVLA